VASPDEDEEATAAAAAHDPLLPADQQLADAMVRGMGLGLTTTRSDLSATEHPTAHGTGAIRRTPSTSSEEEEEEEDLEDHELVPSPDLTSVDRSERYSDIRQLLARPGWPSCPTTITAFKPTTVRQHSTRRHAQ